jgi:hypothetical protein
MRITMLALAATVVTAVVASAAPAGTSSPTVVMKGLDNPRGLSFAPTGALYVAEAGRGGTGPCVDLRGASQCYGPSGAVSRLWHGKQDRIVSGLPSTISPTGEVIGPHDVTAFGLGFGQVTVGWGGDPALRATLGAAGARFGSVLTVGFGHVLRSIDVAAFEASANPGGGPIDSNLYGALAAPGGSTLVTDAGGNTLLKVGLTGSVSSLASFPSRDDGRATDAVPTAVAVGPDGALYVSELSGAPFAAGAARIYRVVPGTEPTVAYEGFKTIMDIAFDGRALYVLEYDSAPVFFGGPGRLTRINQNGTRTLITDQLAHPTSVAVGHDHQLYVTNNGDSVGGGEVLRIKP